MAQIVTPTEVHAVVKKLAEEEPEFVYHTVDGSCYYHEYGDMPGCIIGQALERLGVDTLMLSTGSVDSLDVFAPDDEYEASMEWLRLVQQAQDCSIPWGEAVKLATDRVNGRISARTFIQACSERWDGR